MAAVAKYPVLLSLTSESAKRFTAKPQTGPLSSARRPSQLGVAPSRITGCSGALSRFETHELIESGDLTAIAERAKGITDQPPGT